MPESCLSAPVGSSPALVLRALSWWWESLGFRWGLRCLLAYQSPFWISGSFSKGWSSHPLPTLNYFTSQVRFFQLPIPIKPFFDYVRSWLLVPFLGPLHALPAFSFLAFPIFLLSCPSTVYRPCLVFFSVYCGQFHMHLAVLCLISTIKPVSSITPWSNHVPTLSIWNWNFHFTIPSAVALPLSPQETTQELNVSLSCFIVQMRGFIWK